MIERVSLQPAFVLHSRSYRETSLLVDVLTADYGRLRVIAKGTKKRRTSAQPLSFTALSISWSGRSTLPTLTSIEQMANQLPMAGTSLYCGLYINELTLRLLPMRDACPALFKAYVATLFRIAAEDSPEQALRTFEVSLLAEIGYMPDLLIETDTGTPVRPEQIYRYDIEKGLRRSSAGDGADVVHGSTLLSLAGNRPFGDTERREGKLLMRQVIGHHLGGIHLTSRDLFRFSRETS